MSEILDALSTGVDALSESLADSRAKEADVLIPEVAPTRSGGSVKSGSGQRMGNSWCASVRVKTTAG